VLEVSVEDTGQGLSLEEQEKLFQVFGKLRKEVDLEELNRTGVEMGLAISQSLARRIGPRGNKGIQVDSEDRPVGIKFTFLVEEKERLEKTRNP